MKTGRHLASLVSDLLRRLRYMDEQEMEDLRIGFVNFLYIFLSFFPLSFHFSLSALLFSNLILLYIYSYHRDRRIAIGLSVIQIARSNPKCRKSLQSQWLWVNFF